MAGLLGQRDELLRLVERAFSDNQISVQGNLITGRRARRRAGRPALRRAGAGAPVRPGPRRGQGLARTIDMVRDDLRPSEVLNAEVVRGARGKTVRPEHRRAEALHRRHRAATSSRSASARLGPASPTCRGPGRPGAPGRQVDRIILTRPAVEAGERLGFLPGDLMAKVDPYLRPLYDALYDLVEPEGAQRLLDRGHDRGGPAGLHAGPHPQRLVHHLGRGAEHHARADEDVPHPDRLRLQVRGHRRRDPDRRGRGGARAWWGSRRCWAGSRASPSCTSPGATWCATRSWPTSSRPTRRPNAGDDARADARRWPLTSSPPTSRRTARSTSTVGRPLARAVLEDRGRAGRGRGVAALRRRDGHRRPEPAVPGHERARPTCWPSRSKTTRADRALARPRGHRAGRRAPTRAP